MPAKAGQPNARPCRVVQLDFTPEEEVLCVLFDRSLSIFTITPLKQHSNTSISGVKSSWTSLKFRSFLGSWQSEEGRQNRTEKPPIIYDTCAAEIACCRCCRKIWQRLHVGVWTEAPKQRRVKSSFFCGTSERKRFKWRFGVDSWPYQN